MRIRFIAAALVLLALISLAAGCTPTDPEPEIEPAVAPPVIKEAGVLTVGVDLEYPPFGGTDLGREAGLDIDVAAALAANLGLELKTVDVEPSEAATALADGTVDAMMSVPFSDDALLDTSLAGTYVDNGPAFFVSVEDSAEGTGSVESTTSAEDTETAASEPSFDASLTIDSLSDQKVGAQEGSQAYWILEYEFGSDAIASYPTLREAMDALVAGEIDVLASDAMVTAYIASDGYDTLTFAGQVAPATPLGVAVGLEASELEDALRDALDQLAADGVLTTIRAKWVGDLPELDTETELDTDTETDTETESESAE